MIIIVIYKYLISHLLFCRNGSSFLVHSPVKYSTSYSSECGVKVWQKVVPCTYCTFARSCMYGVVYNLDVNVIAKHKNCHKNLTWPCGQCSHCLVCNHGNGRWFAVILCEYCTIAERVWIKFLYAWKQLATFRPCLCPQQRRYLLAMAICSYISPM
jgi:hypothetical protein